MKDNVGYIVFRTAARDPAVFGNGNGPIGVSSTRALRDPGSYSGDINCPGGAGTQELPGLWPYSSKSTERKNMNQKTVIKILHEEWALNQGLRPKHQAPSSDKNSEQLKNPWVRGSSFKPQATSSRILDPS